MQKKIIFEISPQTYVRATQNDAKLFRIPEAVRKPASQKRVKRLEKYNKYKSDLLGIALSKRFTLPEQGAEIVFYIPVSKSWRKHKKESHHLRLHRNKPDLSNLLKAFEDSLLVEDKGIGNYAGLTKLWTNEEVGRIEVTLHPPRVSSSDNLL